MPAEEPGYWLELIQGGADDLKLAQMLLRSLHPYRAHNSWAEENAIMVLSVFTAIRLHELGKS